MTGVFADFTKPDFKGSVIIRRSSNWQIHPCLSGHYDYHPPYKGHTGRQTPLATRLPQFLRKIWPKIAQWWRLSVIMLKSQLFMASAMLSQDPFLKLTAFSGQFSQFQGRLRYIKVSSPKDIRQYPCPSISREVICYMMFHLWMLWWWWACMIW